MQLFLRPFSRFFVQSFSRFFSHLCQRYLLVCLLSAVFSLWSASVMAQTSAQKFPTATSSTNSSDMDLTLYYQDEVRGSELNTADRVVIDQQAIEDSNAETVGDLLESVSGISVANNGSRGALSSVFIRGADANQVAVYIDGVKVNNPASGSSYNFSTWSLAMVEEIEIIKGGNSVIYGSDAIGGVVLIKTQSGQSAKKQQHQQQVALEAGSYAYQLANVSASGRVDDFYYSVSLLHEQTDGISATNEHDFTYVNDQGNSINSGGATENDPYQSDALFLRLGYDLGTSLLGKAHLEGSYYLTNNQLSYDDGSLGIEDNTGNPHSKTRQQYVYLAAQSDLQQDGQQFKHKIYYTYSHMQDRYYDQYGENSNLGEEQQLSYQFSYQNQLASGAVQDWIVLADYKNSRMQAYNGDNEVDQTGLALEWQQSQKNRYAVRAGLKYDVNELFADDVTFQLGGRYDFNSLVSVFSHLGSANKNPSLMDLYGYGGTYIGNPDLKPETGLGGDIGFELHGFNQQQNISLTYFYRELEDAITLYYDSTGDSYSSNLPGKSIVQGIELGYRAQWTPQLQTTLNYTYLAAHDAEGQDLIRRPQNQLALLWQYQFANDWRLSGNTLWVDKRQDVYFDPNTYEMHGVTLPTYSVSNLGLHYQAGKNWQIYVQLNNLFDKHYEEVAGYSQEGRNAYLGVKGAW